VRQLAPRVEAIAGALLDAALARREVDLVEALTYPLPVIVIAEMIGVPAEDRAQFKAWSDALVAPLGTAFFEVAPPERVATFRRVRGELEGYLVRLVEVRRRAPRDDLLSALVAAELEGSRLSFEELLAMLILLLVAGNETTTNLIGNAVLALLRHPGERKRLLDDPRLLPGAVEEFLRFDSPVQLTDRVVTEDLDFRGHRFRRGQLAVCLLGAANHDPARFPDPDRLDVTRADRGHLAFGLGPHVCLGAPLARLETELALTGLLRRFPDFSGPAEPPARRASVVLRGPSLLPLVL
jgi:hypothetical protein